MIHNEVTQKNAKGERTKQKLFDSAYRLFNEYDFDEVTVDEIVKKAGVAKGTFYIYFESKDELIAAFISEYVKRVDTDYRSTIENLSSDISSSELLMKLIDKICDTLQNTIGHSEMRTVYKLMLTQAMNLQAMKEYSRDLYKIFNDILDSGLKTGEFQTSLTLDALSHHFVMAIRGISYEWCVRYPDFDLSQQAAEHFRVLLSGIQTRS